MAKYDVCPLKTGGGLVIDCQADLLDRLSTRLVVPLVPEDEAPKPAARLNPVFVLDGRRMVMLTQFASAIEIKELGKPVESLSEEWAAIGSALDMLISGF